MSSCNERDPASSVKLHITRTRLLKEVDSSQAVNTQVALHLALNIYLAEGIVSVDGRKFV
jgi:hypothetical protein